MIIIFVEFIDQLIDYPITCVSLISYIFLYEEKQKESHKGRLPCKELPKIYQLYPITLNRLDIIDTFFGVFTF